MTDPQKSYEEYVTQMILHGGNARALSYEALEAARKGEFDLSAERLKEAEKELGLGHKEQTKMLQTAASEVDAARKTGAEIQPHGLRRPRLRRPCLRQDLRDLRPLESDAAPLHSPPSAPASVHTMVLISHAMDHLMAAQAEMGLIAEIVALHRQMGGR